MATFRTRPAAMLSTLTLLSCLSGYVAAHGDHGHIPEGAAISEEPMDSILWAHILLQAFAWGIVFPTGMVLGLVRSRWHVPTQILGTVVAVVGYFLGHLHKGRQFASNAHAKFANLLMLLLIVQVVLGVYLKLHIERGFLGKIRKGLVKGHAVLGGVIPVAAWVQMLLGGIASQGFCLGDHLGQCLAHFIMGSAFIAYGMILTILLLNGQALLARSGRSQEFWDSLVISVWGCINTFTEHRWGSAWVKNDLQHTSMGIIWWAAGLVGIWLSRDRFGRPKRNLIPGIVIFLTGWGMSGHPQELPLSTMVHAVFGYTLMSAGLTRIIEISFILRDKGTLLDVEDPHKEGLAEINSFQYLPPFLLIAGGFLFMGATEEQMDMLSEAHVTHVSYILILYSIAFLLFLFTLMLVHLYSYYRNPPAVPKPGSTPARPTANGHARVPNDADRQAHDAQEFELEGLMSDDDEDGLQKPLNGRAH
ncbi:hypothetical protein K431DRAFT_348842 [Polychaeton citri CBS 116435]|uniref:Integral membrane protein n=1 Tax=Polychaeton citri CBS 116435 TaxID=1314669 RepID=A0A9P4Q2X0_9PEZI|nr:hypothetical protein K431DRAFT_348842 [Polychaeton citri CBS 116435]